MTEIATGTILVVYPCGHFAWRLNGDSMHGACPACYPLPGQSWNLRRGLPVWHVVDGDVQTVATFTDRMRAAEWAEEQGGDLQVLHTTTPLNP